MAAVNAGGGAKTEVEAGTETELEAGAETEAENEVKSGAEAEAPAPLGATLFNESCGQACMPRQGVIHCHS